MKKESIYKIIISFISFIILLLFVYKIDNYLDARIAYESVECNNRAYMIYTNYDKQNEEFKDRDWSLRNSECAKIEAEYKSRDY